MIDEEFENIMKEARDGKIQLREDLQISVKRILNDDSMSQEEACKGEE